MLQLLGEPVNPLLEIVRTLDEVVRSTRHSVPILLAVRVDRTSTPQGQVVPNPYWSWNRDELSEQTSSFGQLITIDRLVS